MLHTSTDPAKGPPLKADLHNWKCLMRGVSNVEYLYDGIRVRLFFNLPPVRDMTLGDTLARYGPHTMIEYVSPPTASNIGTFASFLIEVLAKGGHMPARMLDHQLKLLSKTDPKDALLSYQTLRELGEVMENRPLPDEKKHDLFPNQELKAYLTWLTQVAQQYVQYCASQRGH